MEKTSEETLDILQSVLPRITPERLGRLMPQVKYLKINTEERLNGAVCVAPGGRGGSHRDRRWLGPIRFIGELFKLKMLTQSIAHECIYKLLDDCLEETFAHLDTEEAKPWMDQYFRNIIPEGEVSRKVKLLLQRSVELRLNNWVP